MSVNHLRLQDFLPSEVISYLHRRPPARLRGGNEARSFLVLFALGALGACSSDEGGAIQDIGSGGLRATSGSLGNGGNAPGGSFGSGGIGGAGEQPEASGGSDGSTGGVHSGGRANAAASMGGGSSGGDGVGGASGSSDGMGGGSGGGNDIGTGGAESFDGKELFILFGQSNMSGMSPMPAEPWPVNERVTFMVQYDCPSLGQLKDEWLPAEPPLHGCQWASGGIGLGLADHFGANLAGAWPDAQIGLIPNAIPGTAIETFSKGGTSPGELPDGYTSAYTLMVDRVKEAQKLGRVRAILFHQGESDFNRGLEADWLDKLSSIISNLRTDLSLGQEVPFIAGEIAPTSQWSGHNEYINQVPDVIPNSFVVPSEGTDIHDVAHFDADSASLMGQRYVSTFLEQGEGP